MSLTVKSSHQSQGAVTNSGVVNFDGFEFLSEQVFSIRVLRPSEITREKLGLVALWAAALAVIIAGAVRYVAQPSFWLDEAFVAVSLREPSPHAIFAQLEYGQFFPRLYLASIAAIRELFGYSIWALRLLPFLCFIIATAFWARLLEKRARQFTSLALFSAALLVGASFWLDQAIQLKQYTFDVLFALVPFLIGDNFFKETFINGKRRVLLLALALGCLLSYTYPFALGARVLGWYLNQGRRAGWRVHPSTVFIFAISVAVALVGIWMTDHRFNLIDRPAYLAYWNDCILRSHFEHAPRLIAKFLWGWHGRQPFVTAGMVPLQILGVYSVISRWKNAQATANDSWGSRSIGSLVLLIGMIFASALLGYPICAGRVTLFAQVHTQLLALEGALFVLTFWSRRKAPLAFLYVFLAILMFHSVRDYGRFVRAEAPENIRPMLSLIKPEVADSLWVHSCSVAQVRSLPDALPVEQIKPGTTGRPPKGEKLWVLWTHLGAESCRRELEQIRNQARSWQMIHEGPDRGLALAEF